MTRPEDRETLLIQAAAQWPDKVLPLALEMGLTAADFQTTKAHRYVFQAMARLFLDGRVITEEAVRADLQGERLDASAALLDEVFGPRPGLLERDPLDFRRYVREMMEESFRLAAIDRLLDGASRLKASGEDNVKIVNGVLESLVELKKTRRSDRGGSSAEDLEWLRGLQLKSDSRLVGLDTGFPLMNDRLGGLEKELYALGGATGMGKTTFITQLGFQILSRNPQAKLVFFALDQSRRDILIKFISELSHLPVKFVKTPHAKDRLLLVARQVAIDALARLTDRLVIHDEGRGGIELAEIENECRRARLDHTGDLVVFVDTILAIKGREPLEERLKRLKTLCRQERLACLCTFNLRPDAESRRPTRADLAETGALFFEPYTAMTLYCDHVVHSDTPLIEWEWGTQDMMVPICELNVVKNKMSAFSGRLFYRYLNSLAAFRECVGIEVDNYNAIIDNLEDAGARRPARPEMKPPAR